MGLSEIGFLTLGSDAVLMLFSRPDYCNRPWGGVECRCQTESATANAGKAPIADAPAARGDPRRRATAVAGVAANPGHGQDWAHPVRQDNCPRGREVPGAVSFWPLPGAY